MTIYPHYKIAIAHAAPVFLDAQATIQKASSLIREAARQGAQLIAFPEAFVPAFPVWAALQAPIHNHDLFCALAANALRVGGPELISIADAAREAQVFVSIGFSEGTNISSGCIWNANILIGDDGRILCHHRKIVPTFYEKLIWAPGDGGGLRVVETRLGRLGMLICGENTNPLARYTLMAQGEQVHVSSYPPVWPTHDSAVGENYDLRHAILLRAGAHAFEGKLFNVVASGFLDKAARDRLASRDRSAGHVLDASPRGISVVIGPSGTPVSETMQDEEGILYVDIDLSRCVEPKQFHDVSGGYNRFDIFSLTVNRTAQRPISFTAQGAAPDPAARDEPIAEVGWPGDPERPT